MTFMQISLGVLKFLLQQKTILKKQLTNQTDF